MLTTYCDVQSGSLEMLIFLLLQILKVLALPTTALTPHSVISGSSSEPLSLDFQVQVSFGVLQTPEDPWQVL